MEQSNNYKIILNEEGSLEENFKQELKDEAFCCRTRFVQCTCVSIPGRNTDHRDPFSDLCEFINPQIYVNANWVAHSYNAVDNLWKNGNGSKELAWAIVFGHYMRDNSKDGSILAFNTLLYKEFTNFLINGGEFNVNKIKKEIEKRFEQEGGRLLGPEGSFLMESFKELKGEEIQRTVKKQEEKGK